MKDFAYLHVHTHFSRGGGPGSPAEWCHQAAALGYKALAMADRAPLAGLPAFIEAARRDGLTPIIGVELDLLFPTSGPRIAEPISTPAVLFARDGEGMANLSKLCALAYAGWPASEGPIEWEALVRHSGGLVLVLSGLDDAGATSPVFGLAPKKLAELGGALKEHFGDAAFVGLPHTGRPEDSTLAGQVASAAGHMGLPALAFPTARYLQPEDALSYEALRSAREQAGWPRIGKQKAVGRKQEYLRAPGDVGAMFSEWPKAVENVGRLVEMCSGVRSAECGVRNEAQELDRDSKTLRSVAERRLVKLLGSEELPGDVQERLDAELRVVERCGRAQAWLALGSIVEAARANRVPLGAPLGMADGALLAYALGVSSLNPMPYARPAWLREKEEQASVSLPGVEVPATRRDLLISALAREYGTARIAHAACAVDITPVTAAKAAGAVLDTPGEETKKILLAAMEKGWAAFDADDLSPGTPALAVSLRGAPLYFKHDYDTLLLMPRSQAGNDEADQQGLFPVALDGSANGKGVGKWVPWTEEAVCRLDLPAITLPSSQALTALDSAFHLVGKHPVPSLVASSLDLSTLPEPNEAITSLITKGEVAGIPYLTSKAAKGWSGGYTPEGMAALVAHSIANHKIQNPKSKIQNLEGDLLYRDQLDTLLDVAGVEAEEADQLRRALLKPESAADDALWSSFMEGCIRSGMPEEDTGLLKNALLASAGNLVSRWTMHEWGRVALGASLLKTAHPAALLAGTLAVAWERGARANVAAITAEARRLGITILPPDVNRSHPDPNLEREGASWAIMWGLALLPGWTAEEAEQFISMRPAQGFASLREVALAAADVGLSIAQLESLVYSGACDHLGGQRRDRQALLNALPAMLEWARGSRKSQRQVDLFTAPEAHETPVSDRSTLADSQPSPHERYSYRAWEEVNLGVALTEAREIDALRQALKEAGDLQSRLLTSAQVTPEHVGQSVFLVGILSGISLLPSPKSSNGSDNGHASQGEMPLAVAQVEDMEGAIELVAFPPNYKRHRHLWTEHNLVIITARVRCHEDGALYLLCEHLAPFQVEGAEEELNLKVKIGKNGARPADAPAITPKDALAQTEVIAAPKPQSAPGASNGSHAQHGNGHINGNGNGYSNGHASQAQPVATQATSAPTYKIIITLPISDDDHTDIDMMISLNSILSEHPGSDSVTLRIPYSPEPGAVTIGHLPRGARYSSHLESKLHGLLGPDALAVIKLVG
ncbi:MAG TPA: PHP domain-containing protein [Chloroflexia bacterium]|nr:PHP domain-containing protein [Chloroflexia bacterium]